MWSDLTTLALAAPLLFGARNNAAFELVQQGDLAGAEQAFRDLRGEGYRHAAMGLGYVLRRRAQRTADELERRSLTSEALTCFAETGDQEELATAYGEAGYPEAELALRAALLSDDPLSLFNFAEALHDAGTCAPYLYRHVLGSACPEDLIVPLALEVLAEEVGDPRESEAIYEQLDAEWR